MLHLSSRLNPHHSLLIAYQRTDGKNDCVVIARLILYECTVRERA